MKTAKTLLALVMSLVLIASMMCISVTAAGTGATLSVDKSTVAAGEDVVVTLNIPTEAELGGIDGKITYDADSFDYKDAVTGAATDGRSADIAVKNDAANGEVTYVLLAGETESTEWLVVTFTAKAAVTGAEFGLDFVASNKAGTQEEAIEQEGVEVTVEEEASVEDPEFDLVNVLGATLRLEDKIENQDLAFGGGNTGNLPEGVTIKEIGLLVYPTQLLAGRELLKGAVYDGNPVLSDADAGFASVPSTFYAYVSGTATSEKFIGTRFSCRLYVDYEYKGQTFTAYSKNNNTNATNGTSSKSFYGVLKTKVQKLTNIDEGISAILAKTPSYAERLQVLSYFVSRS